MKLVQFLEILSGKLLYLLILPIMAGGITFFMTRNLPNLYSAETTIYTGITSNNGLEVTVTRVDKVITQNEYNNILSLFKSDAIYQEISLRLLAQHLVLKKAQKDIISEAAFNELQKSVPSEIKKQVVSGNEEATYQNLQKALKQDEKNYLYKILNNSNPYYSISSLQNLKVEQLNSSDMLKLSYNCTDPGICYNTTKIAAQVFISQYGDMKRNLKSSAVKYFQHKLEEIKSTLDNSESQLLDFNITNKIINYYEQTKQVTTQNEKIELLLQENKMNFEASQAVLKKIEVEVSKRYTINLKNIDILNIRNQLVNCNLAIAQTEIKKVPTTTKVEDLYTRKKFLEKRLQNSVDSLYNFDSNSQGLETQQLLSQWLTAVTNFETASANYKSMQERRTEFQKEFEKYAPLGATTKKIEREINVHEGEYLNILNNLNIALQNEQNTDMISKMHIVDEAKYPINSQPAKKKLYILIAIVFTLLFYILGVFIVELMDHRIKTPSLLQAKTDIDVLGAFCLHNHKKFLNTELITHKAAVFIYEKIRELSSEGRHPFVIQILSHWDGAGKTFTSEIIEQELIKRDYKVCNMNFMSVASDVEPHDSPAKIVAKDRYAQYVKVNSYAQLLQEDYTNFDFIISVIPSISRGIENTILLKDADMNLVVFNADLTWVEADIYNLKKIKEIIGSENTFGILTNAQPNNVGELYGEIEKKRSKLRKLIKKMLKRFTK